MADLRVCIVGGGSYNWTPTLLADLALSPTVTGTVVLHDTNESAAHELQRLGQRMMAAYGSSLCVEVASELPAALTGADVVIVTITTGGLDAMRHDLEIPQRYGIWQSVGDTVGPGGLARGLRNIPVMVGLARVMERHCPDAWMLNLTNPMTTLTRAVAMTTRIKIVGLCHEIFGIERMFNRLWGEEERASRTLEAAGINHLTWVLAATSGEHDLLAELRARLDRGESLPVAPIPAGPNASFHDGWRVKSALLEVHGALPGAGDRHVAEFFPYFLNDESGHGERWNVRLTTVDKRVALATAARERVLAMIEGTEPLPQMRSPEPATGIVAAFAGGGAYCGVLNLPNRGQIANLPPDVIVETNAVIDRESADGTGVSTLPPSVVGVLLPHVMNQEQIVRAALTGDRSLALRALAGDPLVRDLATAPALLDELIAAHASYLPAFAS